MHHLTTAKDRNDWMMEDYFVELW